MLTLVALTSPTLLLVWHFSAVVLLNSLLECGSLPLATPLALPACHFLRLACAFRIHLFEQHSLLTVLSGSPLQPS
jgi:hypothetical protein